MGAAARTGQRQGATRGPLWVHYGSTMGPLRAYNAAHTVHTAHIHSTHSTHSHIPHTKAMYRRGLAHKGLQQWEEAVHDFEKAAKLQAHFTLTGLDERVKTNREW